MVENTLQSLKIVSRLDDASRTRTYKNLLLREGGGTVTIGDKLVAAHYMAQRIVALTTRTYGSSDYILTYNTDTEVGS